MKRIRWTTTGLSFSMRLLRLAFAILMNNIECFTKFRSSFYILVSWCYVYYINHRIEMEHKSHSYITPGEVCENTDGVVSSVHGVMVYAQQRGGANVTLMLAKSLICCTNIKRILAQCLVVDGSSLSFTKADPADARVLQCKINYSIKINNTKRLSLSASV